MNIQHVLDTVRRLAPETLAAPWDKSGIQVAGQICDVGKVAVCLDPTPAALAECLAWGAQLVVSHHPLSLTPVQAGAEGPQIEALRLLLPRGAWLYAAHTSLDSRPNGPAWWLAEELGLGELRPIEVTGWLAALMVVFDAGPAASRIAEDLSVEPGVLAVFQEGEGLVRLACGRAAWPALERALVAGLGRATEFYVHALEEPRRAVGFGVLGSLPEPLPLAEFETKLAALLGRDWWLACGPVPQTVARVAFCPGSGSSLVPLAAAAGADVFVSGEIKHHAAIEARCLVLDVGHFLLEEEMTRRFALEIAAAVPDLQVRFFPSPDPLRLCAASREHGPGRPVPDGGPSTIKG
jgi:dinuclear metal center YbgI/SA1388 family protein